MLLMSSGFRPFDAISQPLWPRVCPDSDTARIPGITSPGSNGMTFDAIVTISDALSDWLCMIAHFGARHTDRRVRERQLAVRTGKPADMITVRMRDRDIGNVRRRDLGGH